MAKGKSKRESARRMPLIGWRPLMRKPDTAIAPDEAPRPGETSSSSLTLLHIVVQMFPVFVLLAVLLAILVPILFREAMTTLIAGRAGEDETGTAEQAPLSEDPLPTPDWPLSISLVFTPEVRYWQEDIARWSLIYRLHPNLIATVMQIESCGNPNVESISGALGLFQVMPFHFAEGEDPFDPDTNAMRGLTYFAQGLALADDDVGMAFAGYNGGHGLIQISPTQWPLETQGYQYWGGGIYTDVEAGLLESPTLQDWLASGGASLCAQAAVELGLAEE